MDYPLNTGVWDRALRIVLGLLMLLTGWLGDGGLWSLALRVFALYPLITGITGWCPVYALLRLDTHGKKR